MYAGRLEQSLLKICIFTYRCEYELILSTDTCSIYLAYGLHQEQCAKNFVFPPSLSFSKWERERETAYLNVKVNEEDNQCSHVGRLEHEAAKGKPTWLHSCAERVHNGEEKLDLE